MFNTERIVSRAIIIKSNSILLCKAICKSNYFLPGGGVEKGELPINAMTRELDEELAINITQIKFLGIIQNRWKFINEEMCEKNNIFLVDCDLGTINYNLEKNISFEWFRFNEINSINLQPSCLKLLISQIQNSQIIIPFYFNNNDL